jgi:peptidoglycan/LPS O-acetylase OafA/YrhL
MTLLEVCCAGFVVLFLCFCGTGPLTLGAPWIFGLTVLIFSFEAGMASKILRARPFLFLGALSYSIYMVHTLVIILMSYGVKLAERKSGLVLFREGFFGAERWQGDLFYVVLICLVLGVSYLTYNVIEAPGRRQSRKLADRMFGTLGSSTSASARLVYTEKSRMDDERDHAGKEHSKPRGYEYFWGGAKFLGF